MTDASFELNKTDVDRRFNRAAASFDDAGFAHRQVADSLFDRLDPMTIAPGMVVDLGCAAGAALRALEKRFRKARLIGVDRSPAMLRAADEHRGWLSRQRLVRADAEALPFADHHVDLVFSNLLLPWLPNPDRCFAEVSRVLSKDGLFLFSSLGPDSFQTLGEAFSTIDNSPRINAFADMHDIGDGLVRAGLRDPVLDVERLTITFSSAEKLFDDLSACGARNALAGRRRGLMTRRQLETATQNLSVDGTIRVELEVVYGHAWGSGQKPGAVRIDAGTIPIRRGQIS